MGTVVLAGGTGGAKLAAGLQELDRAEPPIEAVEFEGVERSRPTPEIADALGRADAIVIGPSNPVISIGPILAVPGMREAMRDSTAPVVAVSPFVGGQAVK